MKRLIGISKTLKQILKNSNTELTNKGLNTVNSLGMLASELRKTEINRLPYLLQNKLISLEASDLNNVTYIDRFIFENCKSLMDITIPESVKSIGDYAFNGCSGIKNVTIANGVTSIGSSAFQNCENLMDITIPESVKKIGYQAFLGTGYYKDSSNWDIIGTDRVLYIGKHFIEESFNSFFDVDFTIKSGTLVIGDKAFYSDDTNSRLGSIEIPSTVTHIGESAFENCIRLGSTTIPDSVIDMGEAVFKNCRMRLITIGDGVTEIKAQTFYNCTGLHAVTLGRNITRIADSAFTGCNFIEDIYIRAAKPPILEGPIFVTQILKIHVPIGSGDAYKSATNWSNYYIVEDIEI